MKPFFIFLLLICIKPAFSQLKSSYVQPLDKMQLKQPFVQKEWRGYKSEEQGEQKKIIINTTDSTFQKTQDNMPVVKLADKQTFLFNNGHGSDVYVSSVDNMRVLRPDSTFRASLPVKK